MGKPIETWKPVKGYEGYYAISNYGNIVKVMFVNNRLAKPQIKPIAATDNGHGYLLVSLSKDGKRKNHYVHRLVAEHFVDKPAETECVNHKDYNTKNNVFTNLEWCTQKENVIHSVVNMKKPKLKCKPTNTGEKYIRYRANRYVVSFKKITKSFDNISDAVAFRNEVVR